jgi:hypothetical protein
MAIFIYLSVFGLFRLTNILVHYETTWIGPGLPQSDGKMNVTHSVDVAHLRDPSRKSISAPYYIFWPLCTLEAYFQSVVGIGNSTLNRFDVSVSMYNED